QPEDPVVMIDIVKDGKTDYRIVRRDAATGNDAGRMSAIKLGQAIKAATGCAIELTTDWTPDEDGKAYEILIGKVERPAYAQVPTDLAKDEFVILFVGNKILIDGGSESAITNAVEYFIREYLGYDEEQDTYAKTDLAIPEALNLRTTFDYPYEVYIIHDIQGVNGFTNNEDYNDIVRLYTTLQGRLNKKAKENGFFVYQFYDSTDSFWLDYISGDGKLLEGSPQIHLNSWGDVWNALGSYILDAGIVLWDPNVPATANVASTICSVEGFLPVRYDTDEDSLYTWLINHGVKVQEDLCDMFDGVKGTTIADTDIPSSGSIKCDPYLWALEKYGDLVNPEMVAYTLDGASQVATNIIYQRAAVATTPASNQIYSHDYYIYNECFFIDLTCVEDEKPCDDPTQPMGTDAATLRKVLSTMEQRNNGKMTKLMGFPPWYMKYTTFLDHGKTEPVALEWAFVSLITEYNFIKEADAAHPAWMTNASVYCQYEMTTTSFENNDSPLEEVYDENVKYFTIYIGDYDSSAWLKEMVPDCFTSSERGKMPMMWAFNPNLSDRVPMIFDYIYENKTELDYFVTGDSGAGYVMPTMLKDMDIWIEYNRPYLDKFDMDIVGFIINAKPLTMRELEAYAEISPYGSFHNDGSKYLTVLNGETVYMNMYDIYPFADGWKEGMYDWINGKNTNFAAYRTIRMYTPDLVRAVNEFIEYANAKNDGYTYKYVDMYTLFDLVLQSGQGNYVYSD
ncbi:MAG: hypothetical protein IKY29_05310, partial [Clostridia bacterium]|nr:hypothetical protein [Clostridia bacterium]